MTGRRLLAVGSAVAAVLLIGGGWALWPRGTTEITEQDAVEHFRSREGTAGTGSPSATAGPREAVAVPAPGVYTYRASGREEVKLGPLPAEHRRLSPTVTAELVDLGDGCFDWTVNFFAEHTEDTRYCGDRSGGLELERHAKHQRIGALSPTATLTCDPGTIVEPDAKTSTLRCQLELAGGPTAVRTTLTGTSTAGTPETLAVGGTEVDATPHTVTFDVTGDLRGTWSEVLWLTDDHLPVRVERRLDLSGPARFTERSDLELVELDPVR